MSAASIYPSSTTQPPTNPYLSSLAASTSTSSLRLRSPISTPVNGSRKAPLSNDLHSIKLHDNDSVDQIPMLDVQPAVPTTHNDTVSVPWIILLCERCGVHYGWFVLPVSGLLYFSAVPGMTFGIGFYSEYFHNDLQLSRSAVSTCWTIALIASSFCIPACGVVLDRYGAKQVLKYTVLPYVLLIALTSQVNGVVSLTLAMFLLRVYMALYELMGQWLTNQWFVQMKGRAMTVTALVGASSLVWPSVLQLFSDRVGWRNSYICQAVFWGVLLICFIPLVVDRPEAVGRLPDAKWKSEQLLRRNKSDAQLIEMERLTTSDDMCSNTNRATNGISPRNTAAAQSTDSGGITVASDQPEEIHWRYEDAIRTRMFWACNLSTAVMAIFWASYNMFYESILAEQQIPGKYAESLFLVIAAGDLSSQLYMGVIFEKLKIKSRGLMVGTICAVVEGVLLVTTSTLWQAIAFGFIYGSSDGVLMVGFTTVFSYSFGRADLGKIDSLAAAIYTGSCGLGPIAFGYCKEYFGSYHPAIYCTMGMAAIATLLLCFEKTPIPPPPERRLKLVS